MKEFESKDTPAATIKVRAGGPRPTTATPRYYFSTGQLYSLLALSHASLAIPLMFSCGLTTQFSFVKEAAEPVDQQHCVAWKVYAGGLFTSAGMALALEELARSNLLHTYTADILKMGLIGHMIASIFLFILYPRVLSIGWIVLEGLAALFTGILPASSLVTNSEDRSRVWSDFRTARNIRFRTSAATGGRSRFSWLAIMYNVLTLAFPMAGMTYVLAPRWSLYHAFGYDYGASTHYLWQLIGAGALLTTLPACVMALKHKADIQRMAATPARIMNMGLMGTSVAHLLTLGPIKAGGGVLLPVILGTWTAALLTSTLGLVAPEVIEMAEDVVEAAKHQ